MTMRESEQNSSIVALACALRTQRMFPTVPLKNQTNVFIGHKKNVPIRFVASLHTGDVMQELNLSHSKLLKNTIKANRPFSTLPKRNRKKAQAKPTPPLAEIDNVWNILPNVRTHRKTTTKVYKNAKRLIFALAQGRLVEHIEDMTAFLAGMARQGLKPSQVKPLLTKRFSKKERLEVYTRLSAWRNIKTSSIAKYMPPALPSLIYCPQTHMSWFLFAYLVPPRNSVVIFASPVEDWCAEIILDFLSGNVHSTQSLKLAVRSLVTFWEDVVLGTLSPTGISEIRSVHTLLGKYCEFVEEHYAGRSASFNIGWFKPESVPFRKFLVKIYSWYGNVQGERSERFYRRQFGV